MTRWAAAVDANNVHPEYPRPQMRRDAWLNLNGRWEYAIRPRDEGRPATFDGEILVPFPAESALSGVMKQVGESHRLWYRRQFDAPERPAGHRALLHFGAVDWHATVWINDVEVGEHKGGYTPFTFDITDVLVDGEQEIVVSVWDPTDSGFQPRGKQVGEPRGIWYTAVTGIWQTVWLESVPAYSIAGLQITPDIDAGALRLRATARGSGGPTSVVPGPSVPEITVHALAGDGETVVAAASGPVASVIALEIPEAKLWTPDAPFLYDLQVELRRDGEVVDAVDSYFGMRKISLGKDANGINRLFLNNEPLFQYGTLDQGWWPDGLYTAPTDEALRSDIEVLERLGFNMTRKHVKIEPARWYYHCDKLGLLVWQDMPNGDGHIGREDPDLERTEESAQNYMRELGEMIDLLRNHPSIVVWVPFNEGWGQFDTDGVLAWVKEYDPTRLVDGPSGWTDRGSGDIHDIHSYPGPAMPDLEPGRAVVLGEFGGLGWPVEGHLWRDRDNWGYRTYETREELWDNYRRLIEQLRPMIEAGLAAAIYTQTTDVEIEVNGLMTYDREVIKLDGEEMMRTNRSLYTEASRTWIGATGRR
jgi:beta-galactosidase/beta-glucuronidase